ncbi:hypothetical protein DFH11DRAFT_1731221 [Phellopilus nigrolimitatus]|nr:hypothetical protein DFH11DRAFT_1731221 [Phellopilus nigrolimitatus]
MARKPQTNQKTNACKKCSYQTRSVSSQLAQDRIELIRAQQAQAGAGRAESQADPGCNRRQSGNGPPPVLLPLGLGTINIPTGAQRADIRFNCVTTRTATGQVTHNLTVQIDVNYRSPNPV